MQGAAGRGQDAGDSRQYAGCRMQDAVGCGQGTGCSVQDAGCRMHVTCEPSKSPSLPQVYL